ncbi:uncharacterized protein LTR77_005549 [Saxophila tyrrhenica]|uniref:Uncharacterized protein n=1 Tax=Saxophila tyrrhenica TaxID=1690608 RepID=A0AAV9P9D5_9PEZI|nr:hypothetical protein LTR77_005549 [Saxophila tyrrhenica]
MAANGGTMKDFLPIPDTLSPVTEPDKEEVFQTMADSPTMSHTLAASDHDEKGIAQEAHDLEVKDVGWHEPEKNIPTPLVGGLANDDLWILVRRFNKQMYHVKEMTAPAPGNLDLNVADEDEFSPDKFRATVERLYMTVIIGVLGAVKHIARLRSWKEARRTTAFAAAYFIAWLFDFLVPLFSLTFIALIVYPPSRDMLFPPAPLALVSSSEGGVQKPKAGVLGSTDSATGAPENFKGEAVEAEASNFVNSITSVALASATGKNPQHEPPHTAENEGPSAQIPDPTAMVAEAGDARVSANGGTSNAKSDKTKEPMENAMWNKMRPVMHGVADVADTWERMANALSPTPPFPHDMYRLRIAAVIVPMLAVSIFVTSYMFMKGLTFGAGFGFFGDPVIQRGLKWLNTNYPNWQKLLELRNTLLKGVPTNAQLTLTLLRIGESNKAPLPPPPTANEPPPDEPVDLTDDHIRATGSDWPLNATNEELEKAMEHDPNTPYETAGDDVASAKKKTHGGKAHHMLSAVKKSIKGSIETTLGADHLKAKAGSETSKQRLGVIPRNKEQQLSGPIEFKCRFHGKRGHAYISTKATIPCVSFSQNKSIATEGTDARGDEELKPIWSIPVAEVTEMKKLGGLGWKAKLVVGWALDREIADGIEIKDKQGNSYILTAMVLRDELFNRLISISGQKWQAW